MKGLSTRASAACLLLCCCKIDFSPFLPHAHKRFAVPKPCVQGTDKLEEIRNWGMGAVVVSQVLSHPQSQTQQALSPRKKKCKNKFAQMSSTTDLSLNFTLPVFQNITVHLLWGLVPHPTMRPQNCQHLLLPLCAYGKQVPTCHLCHQLGLWQGKKRNRFSHPCRGSWGLGHNCWRVTWACREYVHGKLSRANFPFLFCPCACAIQLLIQFHKMGTDRKVEKNKPDMGMCCENNYRKLSS